MDPMLFATMIETGHRIFHAALERDDESQILVSLNQSEAAVIGLGLILAGFAYSDCPMTNVARDLVTKFQEIIAAQQPGTPGWMPSNDEHIEI